MIAARGEVKTDADKHAAPLLAARGLFGGYGKVTIVRDLDLEVYPGEVVALVGPNGAGKTTTLLSLSGQIPALGGHVELRGSRTTAPLSRRAREGLGFVSEERPVIMGLTVLENIRVSRGDIILVTELFPDLVPHFKRPVGLLSGGQQRMVALARILSRRPSVLLADELSLGLAPIIVDRILSEVRLAADRGVGVLLVEQHVHKALAIADRVVVLRQGRVQLAGAAADLRDRMDDVRNAYLTPGISAGPARNLNSNGKSEYRELENQEGKEMTLERALSRHITSRTGPRRGRSCVTVVGGILLAAVLAACGSGSSATAGGSTKASGTPIVLFTLASKETLPGVGIAMNAAAKAINAAGGIKNPGGGPARPLQIVVCDDLAGANAAAACGREAITDHAVAVVGAETAYGSAFDPIVVGAGIPLVAQGPYAPTDLTSSLSFPITNSFASGSGGGFVELAKTLGIKSVYSVLFNLPQATSLLPHYKTAIAAAGLKNAGSSLVDATSSAAPDYTPYAAAAASSGAQAIYIDLGPASVGLMKALLSQGVNFEKTAVIVDTNDINVAALAPLGAGMNGIYLMGNSVPTTDNQIPAVAQFNKEWDAYSNSTAPRTEAAEMGWVGVHVVANLLTKMKTISSAALVTAMRNAGPISPGLTPPFNWSKNAFTSGWMAQYRIFTNQVMISRIVGGKEVDVVPGFVPLLGTYPLSAAGLLAP